MKTRILIILFCLLFVSTQVQAQFIKNVSKVGTSAAPFLTVEVGSRALAMGGAFVAVANDATALYWNPGGVARLPRTMVILNHSEWIADISFDFAGIAIPLSNADAIGLSVTSLTMDEMKVRTVFYPEGTGENFGAADLAINGTYARSLTDRFSIGFSGKYIQQKLWHMTSSAFAVDVGILFNTQFKDMKLGMSISNFGSKMRLEGIDTQVTHDVNESKAGNNDKIIAHLQTDKWSLPLTFRFGIALDVLKTARNHILFALDAVHPSDNVEYLNVGMEYGLNKNIFLRAGYKTLFLRDSEEGLTLGAGLAYELMGRVNLHIDYAYLDFGILDNVQRFSLGFDF